MLQRVGSCSARRAGIASALVVIAAGAFLLAGCGDSGQPVSASGHPSLEAQPPEQAELRTVLVFTDGSTAPSATPLSLNAELVEGPAPSQTAVATVLTDTDCAPDAAGISHCLNELQLADGSRLVVRHPHDMSIVPCLSPGEQVRVAPA